LFGQWALLALGAFLVGLSKTGIAGLGILNVAIFATVLDPKQSTGAVLPILISADIVAVLAYRRHAVWHHLWRLIPWAVVGIIVGFFAMERIDTRQVGRLIGAILLVLIVVDWWRQRRLGDADVPHSPSFTSIMGVSAGFTTQVANAAGPIMILYLRAMKLPKMEFIGTGAWYFLMLNCFKVPFMMEAGQITSQSFMVSARMFPFAVGGALFGRAIIKHIKQEWFEKTAITLTILAAFKLLLFS
jgi:uncharacterized membrane protein YfcA